MRRLSTITLIIGALIAMALPASAGKGGNRPPKDSYYKGTCAAAEWSEEGEYPGDVYPGDVVIGDSFTVFIGGKGTDYPQTACVDVLPTNAGPWTISVSDVSTGTKPPRFGDLTLIVRDSVSPGDICALREIPGTLVEPPEPLLEAIPAATVNACDPPGDWAELIHKNIGEAPWDANEICQEAVGTDAPCLVGGPMDSVHPLAFQAAFSGSRNAAARIDVTLP
jgi:hypothetical protein